MTHRHTPRRVVIVLAGLVAALWLYPWLTTHRYRSLSEQQPATEFVVTSPFDNGPGSLREALFSALRADSATVIVLKTRSVQVDTPLPPLVGGGSIMLRSAAEPTEITTARELDSPVFDIRAGEVTIQNVLVRGARTYAVRTSSSEPVRLSKVTIEDSGVGVGAAGNFDLDISGSMFEGNRVGVEALGPGVTRVEKSTFRGQAEAAIWAVGSPAQPLEKGEIEASGNKIDGGRFGVVLGNLQARLSDNEISDFDGDGVIALGGSVELKENRIWNGRGTAIRSIGARSGIVEGNDIHESAAMGILVQSAEAASVTGNKVYRNGYGIVTLLNADRAAVELRNNLVLAQRIDGLAVVGDSPLIVGNRSLRNHAAGIRLFNLVMRSSHRMAMPVLTGNVFEENGFDDPVVSDYVVQGIVR